MASQLRCTSKSVDRYAGASRSLTAVSAASRRQRKPGASAAAAAAMARRRRQRLATKQSPGMWWLVCKPQEQAKPALLSAALLCGRLPQQLRRRNCVCVCGAGFDCCPSAIFRETACRYEDSFW